MWLSIVIPTYHDDSKLIELQKQLLSWDLTSVEIIVVDGECRSKPQFLDPQFFYLNSEAEANRGKQLYLGGEFAHGEKLLFLHADSKFPQKSPLSILRYTNCDIGYFRLRFDQPGKFFKMMEFGTELRTKVRGLIFGDQGLFIDRKIYRWLGGFPQLPIMEDYEFARIIKRRHLYVHQFNYPIITSARKYQEQGHWKAFLTMQCYQIQYELGTNVDHLRRVYYQEESYDKRNFN